MAPFFYKYKKGIIIMRLNQLLESSKDKKSYLAYFSIEGPVSKNIRFTVFEDSKDCSNYIKMLKQVNYNSTMSHRKIKLQDKKICVAEFDASRKDKLADVICLCVGYSESSVLSLAKLLIKNVYIMGYDDPTEMYDDIYVTDCIYR